MDHIFSSKNRPFVSMRLQSRIVIFLIIGVVLLGLMGYDYYTGKITLETGSIGLLVGLVLGFLFGRLTRVVWDETSEQVMTQIDIFYFILIGGYLVLSLARHALLDRFFSGGTLLGITYAAGAGILFGRFFGLHASIMRTLKTKKP